MLFLKENSENSKKYWKVLKYDRRNEKLSRRKGYKIGEISLKETKKKGKHIEVRQRKSFKN